MCSGHFSSPSLQVPASSYSVSSGPRPPGHTNVHVTHSSSKMPPLGRIIEFPQPADLQNHATVPTPAPTASITDQLGSQCTRPLSPEKPQLSNPQPQAMFLQIITCLLLPMPGIGLLAEREMLLVWCQRATENRRPFSLQRFTGSFVLCSLAPDTQ